MTTATETPAVVETATETPVSAAAEPAPPAKRTLPLTGQTQRLAPTSRAKPPKKPAEAAPAKPAAKAAAPKETPAVRAERARAAREAGRSAADRRAAVVAALDAFRLAAEALAKVDPVQLEAAYVRERARAGATVDEVARELPAKFPGTGAAKSPRGYASWYSKH